MGVAVVTGAGSGLGRGISGALLGAGWQVALAGRRAETLRETAEAAGQAAGNALAVPTDVDLPGVGGRPVRRGLASAGAAWTCW